MYLMVPVNVISRECGKKCPRFQVRVMDDRSNGEVVDRDMECVHYDECLNTVNMYQRGLEREERK